MKTTLLAFLLAAFAGAAFGVDKDPLVGFYRGSSGDGRSMCAEVFRTGPDSDPVYRVKLLPAIFNRCEVIAQMNSLKAKGGELKFDNPACSGTVSAKGAKIKRGNVVYNLEKYDYVSPTMGAKPPEGAVVLFDGSNMDAWSHFDGSKPLWALENAEMVVKPMVKNAEGKNVGGSIRTKEKFSGPFKLHVEFNLPPNYGKDVPGQRANSGVYCGDFEIQILEGFGFEGNWGDIGAVYRQVPPQVNACTEPGTWQTFDIIFKPAKVEEGRVLLPRFTVWHNGIRIHMDSPVMYATAMSPKDGLKYKHSEDPIFIHLQDHGSKIRFRNIWLQKLD